MNRHYYSMAISYRKNELEQKMLLNVHKSEWAAGLKVKDWDKHEKSLEELLQAFKVMPTF